MQNTSSPFPWYSRSEPNGFEIHAVPLEQLPDWTNIEACIERAKAEPELCSLFMEGDWGGYQILACPMTMVRASARSLVTLHIDLSWIDSSSGFQTQVQLPDDGVQLHWCRYPGGNSRITDLNLYVKEHDADLREQILRVLSGEQERLELPECYPHDPRWVDRIADTLEEAQEHPYCSAVYAGFKGYRELLHVPARLIQIPLPDVHQLMLDMIDSRPAPTDSFPHGRSNLNPEYTFWMYGINHRESSDYICIHWRWLDDEETRERARAVLIGERDRF